MDYSINALSNQSFQGIKTNPDDYAQEYANKNGLSLEEAKEELKAKWGDPQKPDTTSSDYNTSVFDKYTAEDNTLVGAYDETEEGKAINPDEFAQFYADEKGISLDEAKEELKELLGEPDKQSGINKLIEFFKQYTEENHEYKELGIYDDRGFISLDDGPQKPGDPQFPGQPTLNRKDGPQKPGDPQSPILGPEQLKEIPFNIEDYILE